MGLVLWYNKVDGCFNMVDDYIKMVDRCIKTVDGCIKTARDKSWKYGHINTAVDCIYTATPRRSMAVLKQRMTSRPVGILASKSPLC